MKTVNVPKIIPVSDLNEIFDTLPLHSIDCCNWPNDFPYTPDAGFKLFHDGKRLYIKFFVTENDIKAAVTEDQGRTWTDPCVEFFVSLFPRACSWNEAKWNIKCGVFLLSFH